MSDRICQVEMMLGELCGRQSRRNGKCIFHLEDKSYEEAKEFEKEIFEELKRMEEDENIQVLDFTKFEFPATHYLEGRVYISFRSRIFEKPVRFYLCRFRSAADFNNATFKKADFWQTEFHDVADFTDAKFYDRADFVFAKFYGKRVHFNVATFKEVYFNFAEFRVREEVYFDRSEFLGIAQFVDVKFRSENKNTNIISFRNVRFHKPKEVKFVKVDLRNFPS